MRLSRRALLAALPLMSCNSRTTDMPENRSASERFRLAVCNETFPDASFAEGCRLALATGYTGIEVAPFTLSEDPASISAEQRREYRDVIASEGVGYVGLHSLLTAPRGELHITTPDEAVRRKSWEYFEKLVDLCADLGDNGVMVLGSGKQRNAIDGVTAGDARNRIRDGLAALAPHARSRGVMILPETLAPHLSNVLTSLDETVAMVKEINHPAIRTLFDTHNAAAETEPHDQLIKRYADYIEHVHINEMDGRHPGTGAYDFSVVLRALREIGYQKWVSLEVFKFEPSGEEVARESAEFLRGIEARLDAAAS